MKENFRFRVSIYFSQIVGENKIKTHKEYFNTKDELICFLQSTDNNNINACYVYDCLKNEVIGKDKESILDNLALGEIIDNYYFELTKLGAINTVYSKSSKSIYFSSIHNDKRYRLSNHKCKNKGFKGVSIVINLETSLESVVKQFLGYE